MEIVAVEVVERGGELVGVDLGVDVQRVQDVGPRQAGVEEGLAEGVDDRLFAAVPELAAPERERSGEDGGVSRRRRRPRRCAGSRSGPPRS
jgi:hypothetical protein